MTASADFFVVGIAATELAAGERRILRANSPAGIILFARNVAEEEQLRSLVSDLRQEVPGVLIFVDQEGGPVDRFRTLLGETPSFAAAANGEISRAAGELAGESCALFGVDVDLAPVLDRSVGEAAGRVLAGRTASEDPRVVARAAEEFIRGLADFGVASCLKHFPGLGRAAVDSHFELPAVDADEREDARDLDPFRTLRDLAPSVMISHAAVRGRTLPASLDPAIATALLRDDLGYRGIAISDDLEMGALSRSGDLASRSVAAFVAGCDLLCVSSQLEEFLRCAEALAPAAQGPRGEEARRRIENFRHRCAEIHGRASRTPRALQEIAAAAAALVRRVRI